MALPVKQKTWVISPNNRITFVSLLDTMQRYLHGVKTFLKANGYTVKGSASAGTGAMDGVDRWTATTDVTPRATVDAASQAWIVLTDASGVDILLDYQGASDDICRISMAADGTFVAAGTPNQRPTATGEQVLLSATTIIGATASGDRLWSGWVDSTHKLCRFAVASGGTFVGKYWGVELVSPVVVSPTVWSPPTWGFGWSAATPGTFPVGTSSSTAGFFRSVVSGVPKLCTAITGMETFGASTVLSANVKWPAQGGAGYGMLTASIGTSTSGAEGKYGNLFDHWYLNGNNGTIGAIGDTLGSLEFIDMGIAGNGGGIVVWPWDGVTTPVLT